MNNHRRFVTLASACVIAILTQAAGAAVTIQFTTYQLGGSTNAATLKANGWVGVLLTATSDANPIGGFDLDTAGRGITGTFVQASTLQDAFGNTTPATSTPQGLTPSTAAGSIVNIEDSFFSTFPGMGFASTVALAENNNGSSHAPTVTPQTTFDFVPLTDTAAIDFGIGTRLNGAGSFTANQITSLPLAFVIVPAGSTITVDGQFANKGTALSQGFIVNQSFLVPGGTAVPEPASLGVFAAGSLAFFARRRRKA